MPSKKAVKKNSRLKKTQASVTEKRVARSYASPDTRKLGPNRTVVRVSERPRYERQSWISRDRAGFACAARRHRYSASGKVLAPPPRRSQHPKLCRSAAYPSCLVGWFPGHSVFP